MAIGSGGLPNYKVDFQVLFIRTGDLSIVAEDGTAPLPYTIEFETFELYGVDNYDCDLASIILCLISAAICLLNSDLKIFFIFQLKKAILDKK